ncbi:RCC1 domain-containing protein [Butyricicoccus sp.]|uniref:RCC1 domain-containing protein n=1 Tax=Butyricicoccus sp. TaxID=2049021 RepID=UPI003F1867FF
MATGRERNGKIAVLCGTVVVVAVIAVAMFIGMSKSGATDKMTSAQMACGEDHVLVVDAAGDVYAWGHNLKGELGDVTCDNKSEPVKIEVPGKVVQVAAGDELSFALCKNGDLYAWGNNESYQMGDGMNISRMEPEKVMEDVKAIAAGSYHALAIKKDNALYVWGRNKDGALGISESECDQTDEDGYACQSTAVKLMDDVTAISAGLDYSMAVTSDGTLYAWGHNVEGQLGLAKTDSTNADGQPYQSVPAKVMDDVSEVACGGRYQALALTTNGDLYCWGNASVGSVGTREVDDTENMIQTQPLKIMSDVREISAGSAHSLALTNDGTLYTWGVNNYGQIGIKKGEFQYAIGEEAIYCQATPVKLAENVEAIAAGGFMSLYRSSDGVLKSVGCNLYGQLGIGSEESSISTPHAVYLK